MVNLASRWWWLTLINWHVFVHGSAPRSAERGGWCPLREAVTPNYRLFRCYRYDICGSSAARVWLGSWASAHATNAAVRKFMVNLASRWWWLTLINWQVFVHGSAPRSAERGGWCLRSADLAWILHLRAIEDAAVKSTITRMI
jgi:hypothetical protein